MAKYAMDRVAARLNNINQRWIKLNERTSALAGDDPGLQALANESEQLRGEFANIASLGNPDSWRLLAEGNHFIMPDTNNPEALAEHIARQYVNIPELIRAIQNAIGRDDEQDDKSNTGDTANTGDTGV